MSYRVVTCLLVGAAVAFAFGRASWSALAGGRADPAPAADPGSLPDLQWQGVGSCAAAACHGSGERGRPRGEYTTWIDHDRHARAYEVLGTERSERIVRNLYGTGAERAARTALCLGCHATAAPEGRRAERFALEDGVGCESCHGPAEKWRAEHYLASWKSKSDAEKAALGMRPTRDLVARAKGCVACHVGAGDRDVNHDLIAAGHPRLRFEYGLYSARMPKHWSEQEEKARVPDLEARVWVLGQAVVAEAALELLASRAAGAANQKPWPEFAEYGCFGCHHDLREPSPYRQSTDRQRRPGALPWGTWYGALTAELAGEFPGLDLSEQAPLAQLQRLMSNPNPAPAKVADQARVAAKDLDGWLTALRGQRYDAGTVHRLLTDLVAKGRAKTASSWDEAAQEYLAVAALYHGLTDLDPHWRTPRLKEAVEGLVGPLEFPQHYDSPPRFDPQAFREKLKAVQDRLGP